MDVTQNSSAEAGSPWEGLVQQDVTVGSWELEILCGLTFTVFLYLKEKQKLVSKEPSLGPGVLSAARSCVLRGCSLQSASCPLQAHIQARLGERHCFAEEK